MKHVILHFNKFCLISEFQKQYNKKIKHSICLSKKQRIDYYFEIATFLKHYFLFCKYLKMLNKSLII